MIAINATVLNRQPSGLGVFIRELANHISRLEKNVIVFTSCGDQFPATTVYPATSWVRTKPGSFFGGLFRFLWMQIALPWLLWRVGARVLLSPNHELVLFSPCVQVAVIYDLLPLLYPAQYPRLRLYFRFILPWALRRVNVIVAGSEHTRQDIINYYGIDPSKILVIYPGVDNARFHSLAPECPQPYPYILYVGNQYPYKNLVRLIEAFSRVAKNNHTHHLFLVGKKDRLYYPTLENTVRGLGLESRVEFVDYISNKELPHMYAQADLFVFPSLYEGFGLPPIEAMACGCPVITSDRASLPEVCGDAASYFDPTDVSDMTRAISTVLQKPDLRAEMIERGYKRVQAFKWEETAKQYLMLLSRT